MTRPAGPQVPPHSLEAEVGVIGAALVPGAPLDEIRSLVDAGDFYRPAYASTWAAICGLANRGETIDPLTVATEMHRHGIDGLSAAELVAAQTNATLPRAAVAYARLVRDHARERQALALSAELVNAAQAGRLAEVVPGLLDRLRHLGSCSGTRELLIEDAAVVDARVAASDGAAWLARPVWPGDAYGVLAAEKKAGKTWAALDLAVSVASGGVWLGQYPVETPGPVLVFLGEGGERKMLRRLRAICEAKAVRLPDLPIRLCHRAPNLTSAVHLAEVAQEVEQRHPVLVLVDPLYLSAAGAKSSDLYAMGALLVGIQTVCQEAGAALCLVHHWKKTGEGTGAARMTGVGPAEWGRVLVSVAVEHKATDADRSTVATLHLTFEGDEIPETELRLRRRVWATDPDDLASPLHYRLDALEGGRPEPGSDGLRPAERRVLTVLIEADDWLDTRQIG